MMWQDLTEEQKLTAIIEVTGQRDELKQQLAEAQRVTFDPKVLEQMNEMERQRDELLAALRRLRIACPSRLVCDSFHHAKKDRHQIFEDCKPAVEYLAAIEQANSTLHRAKP